MLNLPERTEFMSQIFAWVPRVQELAKAVAVGGGAGAWYRLQANDNLAQAMERADEIHVERAWPESPVADPIPA